MLSEDFQERLFHLLRECSEIIASSTVLHTHSSRLWIQLWLENTRVVHSHLCQGLEYHTDIDTSFYLFLRCHVLQCSSIPAFNRLWLFPRCVLPRSFPEPALLVTCPSRDLFFSGPVFLGTYSSWDLSFLRPVLPVTWDLSFLGPVLPRTCTSGDLSFWWPVLLGTCPSRDLSFLWHVTCPFRDLSFPELALLVTCLSRDLSFLRPVLPRTCTFFDPPFQKFDENSCIVVWHRQVDRWAGCWCQLSELGYCDCWQRMQSTVRCSTWRHRTACLKCDRPLTEYMVKWTGKSCYMTQSTGASHRVQLSTLVVMLLGKYFCPMAEVMYCLWARLPS